MKNLSLIVVILFFVGTGVTAKASGKKTQKKSKPVSIEAVTTATPKTVKGESVITGTLTCVSETLQEKGANVQCLIYGHKLALKVEKAVLSGSWKPDPNYKGKWPPSDLPHPDSAYKGKIFSFLPNDNSAGLIKDKYIGKKVTIVGKIYSEANIIDVRFVKFTPKKKKKK